MDVEVGAGQRVSLRAVDPGALSAVGRVEALVDVQRLRSWVDAQEQVLLAAMAGPGDAPMAAAPGSAEAGKQYVRGEIACALRISPLTVNARLHVARELTHRLPGMLTLLGEGAVSMRSARFLAEAVGPLPDAAAAEVERRVLPRARGQTFANFRACVQRAVLAADPRGAQQKHELAVEQRRVEARVLEDGMGSIYAVLAADDVQAIMTAVQAAADALPAADYPPAPGTADRRRADALLTLASVASASGLSMVGEWQGRRPSVQVTVALSTLLGVDDEPGELDGHGPIPASLARRIAADSTGTWRRLVTDPLGRSID